VRSEPLNEEEHTPVLTVPLFLLAAGWLIAEFAKEDRMIAISSLNTYRPKTACGRICIH